MRVYKPLSNELHLPWTQKRHILFFYKKSLSFDAISSWQKLAFLLSLSSYTIMSYKFNMLSKFEAFKTQEDATGLTHQCSCTQCYILEPTVLSQSRNFPRIQNHVNCHRMWDNTRSANSNTWEHEQPLSPTLQVVLEVRSEARSSFSAVMHV